MAHPTPLISLRLSPRLHPIPTPGYQKVSKHMSLEDYFMVWRAVGNTIAETMLRGRGSRMDKFGLFGYNTRNEAGFFLDQVFEQTNRVQQVRHCTVSSQSLFLFRIHPIHSNSFAPLLPPSPPHAALVAGREGQPEQHRLQLKVQCRRDG